MFSGCFFVLTTFRGPVSRKRHVYEERISLDMKSTAWKTTDTLLGKRTSACTHAQTDWSELCDSIGKT